MTWRLGLPLTCTVAAILLGGCRGGEERKSAASQTAAGAARGGSRPSPDLASDGPNVPPSSREDRNERTALSSLLPVGSHGVDVMEVGFPKETNAIWARFWRVQQKNPQWLPDYVAKHGKEGSPLPYHPNLGISEAEYRKALAVDPILIRAGSAKLTVESPTEGRLRLRALGTLADLDGIELDLKTVSLVTPLAACGPPERKRGERMRNLGLWDGFVWRKEQDDFAASGNALSVRFHLGRLRSSGKGVIYYRATKASNGRPVAKIRILVTYPMAGR